MLLGSGVGLAAAGIEIFEMAKSLFPSAVFRSDRFSVALVFDPEFQIILPCCQLAWDAIRSGPLVLLMLGRISAYVPPSTAAR